MADKPPVEGGYIDPKIPNPGKDSDASIIIYGYITLPSPLPPTTFPPNQLTVNPSLLFFFFYQLHSLPSPLNPRLDPLRPAPPPAHNSLHHHARLPPLQRSPNHNLALRAGRLYLPTAILAPARGGSVQDDKLHHPVLLHRRRACIPQRGNLHHFDLFDPRVRPPFCLRNRPGSH